MSIQGSKVNIDTLLSAMLNDSVRALAYMLSGKGRKKPKFIAEKLLKGEKQSEVVGMTAEEFEKFRKEVAEDGE